MSEKINIMERACRTCLHLEYANRARCDKCMASNDDRPNWTPRFSCPGDCEAATKLLGERDEARARAEKVEAALDEAMADAEDWKARFIQFDPRDEQIMAHLVQIAELRAEVEKAEAEVARLRGEIQREHKTTMREWDGGEEADR